MTCTMILLRVTVLLLALTTDLQARAYQLMRGDEVDIRVFDRSDLSGAQRVDADGNLRLPLIGVVAAAGRTADEVEAALRDLFRSSAGILDPSVNLIIVQTGPVFVSGTVKNPGRYAWAAGLTAMKAYALAGGSPRFSDPGTLLAVLEGYRAIEQEMQAVVRLAGVILRHARLKAEAAGADVFMPPENWSAGLQADKAAQVLAEEKNLFARRRAALEGELNNLQHQRAVVAEEISAHRAEDAAKSQQEALLREELTMIERPEGQRVVPVPRLLAQRRTIIDIETQRREIERRITESRLRDATIEQSIQNLRNARVVEATSQLVEIEKDLVTARDATELAIRRADAARSLVGEETDGIYSHDRERQYVPKFSIRREVNGRLNVLDADMDTALLPHDLLLVR
jgi:protein involved in polysaccharide export with SLBB domain